MAGRILARTGDPFRFPTEAAFAEYTGTAPVEIASADQAGTDCPGSVTAPSIPPSMSSRWARHGSPATRAMPTTGANSTRARPPAKPNAALNRSYGLENGRTPG
ncbi:MAG: hypothetical protein EOP28_03200 [Rhodococcus sp. (in: high G+C Gram-positive bacteria)]|nr:MAG: hypothetical protein EOP28_03200 [Rhodococcus sp. (in: high G+C Gram-positive bacteria)]